MKDSWNRASQKAHESRPWDSGDSNLFHVKRKTAKNRAVKPNCRTSSICLSTGFLGFDEA